MICSVQRHPQLPNSQWRSCSAPIRGGGVACPPCYVAVICVCSVHQQLVFPVMATSCPRYLHHVPLSYDCILDPATAAQAIVCQAAVAAKRSTAQVEPRDHQECQLRCFRCRIRRCCRGGWTEEHGLHPLPHLCIRAMHGLPCDNGEPGAKAEVTGIRAKRKTRMWIPMTAVG